MRREEHAICTAKVPTMLRFGRLAVVGVAFAVVVDAGALGWKVWTEAEDYMAQDGSKALSYRMEKTASGGRIVDCEETVSSAPFGSYACPRSDDLPSRAVRRRPRRSCCGRFGASIYLLRRRPVPPSVPAGPTHGDELGLVVQLRFF